MRVLAPYKAVWINIVLCLNVVLYSNLFRELMITVLFNRLQLLLAFLKTTLESHTTKPSVLTSSWSAWHLPVWCLLRLVAASAFNCLLNSDVSTCVRNSKELLSTGTLNVEPHQITHFPSLTKTSKLQGDPKTADHWSCEIECHCIFGLN